ncbi:MAG: peptide chain release factor N(5)-glutamine methyltransferase [Pseudomonadales bacterium]|nr:peptide chain release factor N(5)-glutamine methyltransferase [Pseudomonadales bacterium]
MRLDQLISNSTEAISAAQHSDSARLDAELLILHALKQSRSFLYAYPESIVNDDQLVAVNRLVQRRCEGEPVAYLLNQKEFWSVPLLVDERVLIPRPETEALIEYILQLPMAEQACIADLGTGSGAIALALSQENPSWSVTATDYSAGAIEVAQHNTQQFAEQHTGNKISLLRGDWLSAFTEECFDLIVSNPPYIDAQDPHLQQGDVRFEPRSALVSEEQGFADIKCISRQAQLCLKSGGHLIIEHGYDQREAIIKIIQAEGYLNVVDHSDLNAMPRFVTAIKA